MHSMTQALRLATRSLFRTPRFTVLAVATLALGIGITTAFFSVFDAVLLRPLPYGDADRLVTVLESGRSPTSPANFLDLRDRSETLVDLTAASPWSPIWTIEGQPEQIPGLTATAGLFDLLEAEALHGRRFSARAGDDPQHVVVLSYGLWQRRFGGDTAMLGRAFDLDGTPHTIVGIMPDGFAFPPFWATGAEFWAPHDRGHEMWGRRGARFLRVFGRLAPAAELATAQAEIDLLADELAEAHPDDNDALAYTVEPLQEPVVDGVRPALWTIFAAVGVVASIACANAASLWWTRATVRRRDLG
ncbi:MAG: ABC transporter permease, partial [Acidobacteriota bacterium]